MASVYRARGAVVKHLREDGFGAFLEGPTDGGLTLGVDGEGVGVEVDVLDGGCGGLRDWGRTVHEAPEFLVPCPPFRLPRGDEAPAVKGVEEAVLRGAEILTKDGLCTAPDHVSPPFPPLPG